MRRNPSAAADPPLPSNARFLPVNPVIIHDYDPTWPERFATLCARIAALLQDMASAIEHVGSTAVPGLAAKPIIDIDVLLRAPTDLPLVIERLASAGYQHRGDLGVPGREAFKTPPNDIPHHLYVCPPGSPEFRRHITFRDYLRGHAECGTRYATLKLELARKFRNDREGYNLAKTDFVQEVLKRTL
jgi:GrpB-like predicted nucleotidyltransferase (UPF0157 family)